MPAIIYKNKDGVRVPSVTTILSQWGLNKRPLMIWAHKMGEAGKSLNEKTEAQVGTCVHDRIECYIKKKISR